MYTNILVPVALDHAHTAANAIAIARKLMDPGGKITALHVSEDVPAYVTQYLPEGHMAKMRQEQIDALNKEIGDAEGVTCVVVSGHSGRTILDYAEKNKNDLIVVDSHRPGLQDYFLGSTAARIVRHAQCAVHVIR